MGKTDTKIEDFVGFLPHGCIGRHAMEVLLTADANPISYLEYSPQIPMQERIESCDKVHAYASRHILSLVKGEYLDDSILRYGAAHWKTIRVLRLKKAGFNLLVGLTDSDTEDIRLSQCKKHGLSTAQAKKYFALSPSQKDLIRDLSYIDDAALLDSEEMQNRYEQLVAEAISQNATSLLAVGRLNAKDIATMPKEYTGTQYHRLYKLGNIETLFRINNFLTTIDRRPLDKYWRFTDSESLSEKTKKKVMEVDDISGVIEDKEENKENNKDIEWRSKKTSLNICDFVNQTLKKWYLSHPDSYFFFDPFKQLSEEEISLWECTPAFYPAYEIPGFGKEINDDDGIFNKSTNNALRYNFSGLAVGAKCNYLVYHTRPTKTNWSENIERTSSNAVQMAVDHISEKESVQGADRSIDYAIMVCPSMQQFVSLFEAGKKHMPKKWMKIRRVGAPYLGVNIVTLNNAGSMLLRGLMLTTPIQLEESIINAMAQNYPEFTKSSDTIYRLSYKGKPVLVAHSMDFQKLYFAWEDYQSGVEFLVSCYPEQAKFISKLMPNVQFL